MCSCVRYWHALLGCVVRFTLSVFVDGDEEHDEWKDLVQCDRLWLIRPTRARKALLHSGHW